MKAILTLTTLLMPLLLAAETTNINRLEGVWISSFSDYSIEVRSLRGGIEVVGLRDQNRWTVFDRLGRSDRFVDKRGNVIVLRGDRLEFQRDRFGSTEVFYRPQRQVRPQPNRGNACFGGNARSLPFVGGVWFSRDGDRLRINEGRLNTIRANVGKRGRTVILRPDRNRSYVSECGRYTISVRGDRLTLATPRGITRYRR